MWSVWCYECDIEVSYTSVSRLGQLVQFIQKKSKANAKTSNPGQSEQEVSATEKLKDKENSRASDHKEENSNKLNKGDKSTSTALNNNIEATVKGLSNLGNTCFFNAVMQNLSQTPTLRELLNEVILPKKSVTVQLPDCPNQEVYLEQPPGPLILAMCQFLTEMQETKKGVVTPKELFTQVCKKAIRFKGYQQQDSQELLRYLLDGMRGEEIQRISVAMTKALQCTTESADEEEMKKKVKDCEKRRMIPNFVDRLFGGELTSTIMCEECNTVSLVHEPFLDLSLPVLDDTLSKKNASKMSKTFSENKTEEETDDGYVKERNDGSSTSKHLQKKAKKQAKKQAKNQRRHQKLQDKTVLFSDVDSKAKEDSGDDDTSANNPDESKSNVNQDDRTSAEGEDADSMERNTDANTHVETDTTANLESSNENAEEEKLDNDTEVLNKNGENGIVLETTTLENSLEPETEKNTEPGVKCWENNTEVEVRNLENNTEIAMDLEKRTDNQINVDDTGLQTLASPPAGNSHVSHIEEYSNEEDELTKNLNRLNLASALGPEEIQIEIIELPMTQVYEVVNEDPKTAFSTLSERKSLPLDECSVLSCLYQFTHKENLTGNNQLLCNMCSRKALNRPKNNVKGEKKFVYTNAKKQMLVSVPPPILTLHLKRFQQNGFNLHKINKHIKFPELIDLAPFCTVKCKNIPEGESKLLYSLYGVIEHSGTMRSGHYTAYVKLRNPNPELCELVLRGVLPEEPSMEPNKGHWYHVSDSHVQAVPLSKVLSSQAYLLFYERLL
ncbi:ubiquitin carboxyl-terminal hydrolase 16 [Pelodytes ibericus]